MILIGAVIGKPVRFVTGPATGMEVRSIDFVLSPIVIHTCEFIQEMDKMVCIHDFERFYLTAGVV